MRSSEVEVPKCKSQVKWEMRKDPHNLYLRRRISCQIRYILRHGCCLLFAALSHPFLLQASLTQYIETALNIPLKHSLHEILLLP